MEEQEYKSTYNELTRVGCVFEKALTQQQARCSTSQHFWLADREGYSCKDKKSSIKCSKMLDKLRESSAFVLKIHEIDGPLPHNKELRVQAGGIRGLAKLVQLQSDENIDIGRVIASIYRQYHTLDSVPFSQVMPSVEQFKSRHRRK